MKYTDTLEFISQNEPATPCSNSRILITEKIRAGVRSLFAPRVDPARLPQVERREMGLSECDIDRYNALNAPLTK